MRGGKPVNVSGTSSTSFQAGNTTYTNYSDGSMTVTTNEGGQQFSATYPGH